MSIISVVAVEPHAARLFSRQADGIAVNDQIFFEMSDEAFAQRIAAWLEEKAAPREHADRFVLLGAPRMLHALRQTIKSPVCAQVIAEIHRDLETLTQAELKRELEKILWF